MSRHRNAESLDEQFAELFVNRHERPGDVFVQTLKRDKLIVAPGIYNAWGAKAARMNYLERKNKNAPCFYNAAYLGGWAVSAMLWGRPDMGFHDRSMMALIAKYVIPAAYPLPVIVDAETGFAPEPVAIAETVETFHQAGAAVIHLEDQATRRCGNLGGKTCIPAEEMVVKVRAALIAIKELGSSMRLMVRTDALTAVGGGMNDAIERMKRYMDTDYKGARPLISWSDAMMKPEDIEKWLTAMHKHDSDMICGLNYSPNKDWTGYYQKHHGRRPPTYREFYDNGHGFRVIWHTILQARCDMESTYNTFVEMADNGAEVLWNLHERQRTHPVSDTQNMSNFKPWQALDQYIGGEAADERYKKSEGYKDDRAMKK